MHTSTPIPNPPESLELPPGSGQAALALGHAEMSAGNAEAALAAYWNATLLDPKLAAAHSGRALALRLLGRNAEASRAASLAISLDPGDDAAQKVLARIHLDAQQPEAAEKACQQVLEHEANDADARQMLEEAIIQEAQLAENLPVTPAMNAVPAPVFSGRTEHS